MYLDLTKKENLSITIKAEDGTFEYNGVISAETLNKYEVLKRKQNQKVAKNVKIDKNNPEDIELGIARFLEDLEGVEEDLLVAFFGKKKYDELYDLTRDNWEFIRNDLVKNIERKINELDAIIRQKDEDETRKK